MKTRHQNQTHHHKNTWGAFKSERGKRMGCKIARLKTWGAKSHNWQKIGGKVQLSQNDYYFKSKIILKFLLVISQTQTMQV